MIKWVKYFCMAILFSTAMLTTFQGISGVKAKDLVSSIYGTNAVNGGSEISMLEHKFKPVGIAFKFLKKITNSNVKISSSENYVGTQPTLEEAIDWSKYPSETVVATGYTAGYESTGKSPGHPEFGITYSGVKVTRDLYSTVAADLNVFPIGTILFIPGYGYGVVADKGGAIKGNKVDLYYETVAEVYEQWGKKTLDIYVVRKGNGKLTDFDLKALNENESMKVFRQQFIGSKKE